MELYLAFINTWNGIYFGDHTPGLMPVSTGLVLNDAGYGLNRWYGPRVYCDCDINAPFQF